METAKDQLYFFISVALLAYVTSSLKREIRNAILDEVYTVVISHVLYSLWYILVMD